MKQETYTNKQAIQKKEDWKEPRLEVLSIGETQVTKEQNYTENYDNEQPHGRS